MGLFLAIASAIVYGCADFCGGKATRKVSTTAVTFSSQLMGLGVLGVAVWLVPADGPTWRALGFGALGGLGGAAGIMLLYHGLAIGTMSIVSPITAVVAAAIALLVGTVVLGERPGALGMVGIASALVAVVLVSMSPNDGAVVKPLWMVVISIGAGIGFGMFFVMLQQAGKPEHVGLWALVAARPMSILVPGVLARRHRQPLFPSRAAFPLVMLAGVLDQLANVLYVLAIGGGLLSTVAVLASLYPVSTVALARIIDRERLQRVQVMGLGFALAGLVMIAL